jgi:hypothetical protein
MLLKITALVSILTTAFAGGLFWGPWLALTISLRHLPPDVFMARTARLSRNLGRIMTFVLPFSLLTMLPVLWRAYAHQPVIFYCTLAARGLYLLALVVTVRVEVPLVQQMERWTVATLPTGWEQVRDRWGSFHRLRVGAAILGLRVLVAGALFGYEVV